MGLHAAAFDSTAGKVDGAHDPYVLKRAVVHRLHKQIQEENNNRNDLLAVQDSFARFEAHIIKTIQQGMGQFQQILTMQAENTKHMYGDMASTAQRVPPEFEWHSFVKRNNNILIDPSAPPRDIRTVVFPNQDHKATQALIEGALEKKTKLLRKYETNYYAVTPAHFFHEYKTDDVYSKDPVPEMSLYLPDCVIGPLEDTEFSIKGKDVSKGKLGSLVSLSHEFEFKAHTLQDARQWYEVITMAAGQHTGSVSSAGMKSEYGSTPSTPATAVSTSTYPSYADEKILATAVPHSAGAGGYGNLGPVSGYGEQGIRERDMAGTGGLAGSGVERHPGQY